MTLPPPSIVEELSVCSIAVRVKNQLTGALVEILLDSAADPIGGGVADWPDQWFPLNAGVVLVPGQIVRARQALGGQLSPPSSDDVQVQDRSITQPQFIAPLVGCSNIASLGSFAPGATATVSATDGTVLGTQKAAGARVVVTLTRSVVDGEVLLGATDACGAGAAAPVHSPPAEAMRRTPDGRLLTPQLSGEVRECMRILHFTNTQVGATLFLERQSGVLAWQLTDPELYARVDPPLVGDETLTYWQEAPNIRCQAQPSERARRKVATGPPPAPWISSPICPGSRHILLAGLVPSATVRMSSGDTEVLTFEASEESADVDLAGVNLTPDQQLTVAQALCNVFGPTSAVPAVVTQPEEVVRPEIPERLVACAGVVRVGGVIDGAYVQVYSDRLNGRIGHALAGGEFVDLPVAPTLLYPDRVHVVVAGCATGIADRDVDPAVDLPAFSVDVPSDGDRSVYVVNLVAGCLVDATVDGVTAGEAWCGGTEIHIPVAEPLRVGQTIVVAARLCDQRRQADPVTVKPPFQVNWAQPSVYGIEFGATSHMAGRVTAAVWLGPAFGNNIWVGTEEGGIWNVSAGSMPLAGSYDWTTPLIRSMVHGSRSPGHIYCGTTSGIMEADAGAGPGGVFVWTRVNGLPGVPHPAFLGPVPGGLVSDMVVLTGHNLLVAATDHGVWWSPIPPSVGVGYVWSSDPLVSDGSFLSMCEGSDESIVAYRSGAPGTSALFRGTWTVSGLRWDETTPGHDGPPGDARLLTVAAQMVNGRLASCASHREHVYLAVSDAAANWLAVLRSDTGGQSWSVPYTDPTLTMFKPGNAWDMQAYANRLLVIGVHPVDWRIVLIAGQRAGPLGSIDGGGSWDPNRWPNHYDDDPQPFHADCLCLEFDPFDPSGNTLLIGSDGGVFISGDLGVTWDSSTNERFPTLMFDRISEPDAPALSASSQYPGLLVGGLQDNGSVYLPGDGQPWREIIGGDGFRALFVTPDVVLMGSNDKVGIKWAQWAAGKFNNAVQLAPPGYPDPSKFLPPLARVEYPKHRDPAGGALMVGLAGDEQLTNDLFGLFDKGPATDPPMERFYWKKLATLPANVSAVSSLDGKRVLVGCTDTTVHLVYSATGTAVAHSMPADLDARPVRWMRWAGGGIAFCAVGSMLLGTLNLGTWSKVTGTPNTSLEVVEVDRAWDPVGLFVGGSDGVWLSRDLGASWRSTTGLPRRPHVNHLEVVEWPPYQRVIHAGTWNWSAWRANLT